MNDPKEDRPAPNRVYLNGFMGSGKSTVGPLLADSVGWAFYDLDHRIVNEIGCSIAEYFAAFGEPAFRVIETEMLRRTVLHDQHVIAVGGGALCQPENLDWALGEGTVIYLKLEVHQLVQRLKSAHQSRPMLHGGDGRLLSDEALAERIGGLLEARRQFYERSHLIIDGADATPQEIVDRIVEAMSH